MKLDDIVCAVLDNIDPLRLQNPLQGANNFQREVRSDLSPPAAPRSVGECLRAEVRAALLKLGLDPDKPE